MIGERRERGGTLHLTPLVQPWSKALRLPPPWCPVIEPSLHRGVQCLGQWEPRRKWESSSCPSTAEQVDVLGHSFHISLSIDTPKILTISFSLLAVLSQPVPVQGAEFSFPLMILKKLLRNQNMFQSYLQGSL